jgi:cell division protein FtsL
LIPFQAEKQMKRLPSNQTNHVVRREHDHRALSRFVMLLVCGLVLAGGFVFAAQQHFAAVKYGYESEELRLEHSRLIEENRRLLLEREVASTPSRLEARARGLGLQPLQAAQIEVKNAIARNSDKPKGQPLTREPVTAGRKRQR